MHTLHRMEGKKKKRGATSGGVGVSTRGAVFAHAPGAGADQEQ